MDPAKLKVVELRQELANRGLDQKGVKAVLVSRLLEALEKEKDSLDGAHPVASPDASSCRTNESEQNNEVEFNEPSSMEEHEEHSIPSTTDNIQASSVQNVEREQFHSSKEDEIEDEEREREEDESNESETSEIVTKNIEPSQNSDEVVTKMNQIQNDVTDNSTEITSVDEKTESNDISQNCEKEMETADNDDKASSEDNKKDESDSDRKDRKRRRSRSRSRSKSSSPAAKRSRQNTAQNTDDFTNDEDEPEIDPNSVLLSWFDSDLNLKVNSSEFLSARPISEGPLGMAWAGVRASHGVRSGKVCYEVLIDDLNRVQGYYERNLHEIRCGWSVKTTGLQLGEAPLSFGYGGTGKKSTNNEFTDFGCKFVSRGDVVGVYLDLESEPCKIEYTVNGESQGVAFEFDKSELGDEALYPHILSKNTGFKVNFGQLEKTMVSKVKKAVRDERERDRRDYRRDGRRSDRDSRRDRSRSRSRDASRRDKDKEKSPSRKDDEDKPETDNSSKEAMDVDEKTDEKPSDNQSESNDVVNESNDADANKDSNGELAAKDVKPESDEKTILPGYEFINKISIEDLIPGYSRPESRKDCEVILLIGLPGSGKSYWAKNHIDENPDKRYNVLGLQSLLAKMTVNGEARKKHVDVKWERFVDTCTRGVNIIQDIAIKRRRNYIIDQTNVISALQRRKVKGFGDFKRIAVVFVPDDDEYKQRLEKKIENEGKEVSEYSSDDMKANFSIPNNDCWFHDVQFIGLQGDEAKKKVAEYNEKGRKALSSHGGSHNRGSRDYNRRRRDDFRDHRDRDRRWGSDRRDGRSDWRSSQGWGGYDRRDRWHGGGGGNWGNSYRGSRYDDRYRGGNGGGGGGYSRHRDFGHDRDRRDDRRNENRSDRDFRDGNRERRGEDKRRHDRGVPQREKDEKRLSKQSSQNYKSTKSDPPTQGHWNPNFVGQQANNWNNYYQQQQQPSQNWGDYNQQQQNWLQWNQQQNTQSGSYTSQQQQQQQDWSNWQQTQQSVQQQAIQQQDAHGGWHNWTQHAQTYANAGDQSVAPK